MLVSRFTERSTIEDRMAGFMAHLRLNGFPAGLGETETALRAMQAIEPLNPDELRLALSSICATNADRKQRFNDLFRAYWLSDGRIRHENRPKGHDRQDRRSVQTSNIRAHEIAAGSSGTPDAPDDGQDGEVETGGEGQLVAARIENLRKTDLRHLVTPEDIAEAERMAFQLARAIRDRRSRRRKAARRGAQLDLRRIARHSVAHGGDPIELFQRKRPDRPVRLSVILDVSGSMMIYARAFLAFVRGLVSADLHTEAYLLHTRLIRVTDTMREGETLKSVGRLSLMSSGIGGGTKIGENLKTFCSQYARHSVNSRSVVIILSDGYDTGDPALVGEALARLKKRGCRVLWLNPLKGWAGYEPVARGMAAAIPHLDLFASANTLEGLAALEPELARL
ncbi:MAG: VWA domain-containing protein [Pseudomonadota bacterium]